MAYNETRRRGMHGSNHFFKGCQKPQVDEPANQVLYQQIQHRRAAVSDTWARKFGQNYPFMSLRNE